MKREIKFRAFTMPECEMVYSDEYKEIDKENPLAEFFNCQTDNIMQYTGLKDKNGKDIYEGDIVECGYGKGKIVFKSGCFMVEWIDDKEAYLEFLFSRKGMYIRKDDEQFVLIGNIYENQEI